MSWVSRNTSLIQDIRTYAIGFESVYPHFFQYFKDKASPALPFAVSSEAGLRMLLIYSALWQHVNEKQLADFLLKSFQHYGPRIFTLSSVVFDELRTFVNATVDFEWSLKVKIPGILRSCADFFSINGNLRSLIENCRGSESLVEFISQRIFFMGKSSKSKYKARTFACLVVLADKSLGPSIWSEASLLPISRGAIRLMHYFGPLKGRTKQVAGEENLEYFNRFYNHLFPAESWRLYEAFNAYHKREKINEFKCQRILSGCHHCVLDRYCWPNGKTGFQGQSQRQSD